MPRQHTAAEEINPQQSALGEPREFTIGQWLPFNSSRVEQARYSHSHHQLQVQWKDSGRAYYYDGVSPAEWRNFRRSASPGKFVNRVLNNKPYGPLLTEDELVGGLLPEDQ